MEVDRQMANPLMLITVILLLPRCCRRVATTAVSGSKSPQEEVRKSYGFAKEAIIHGLMRTRAEPLSLSV
jgi:hypothetical protein